MTGLDTALTVLMIGHSLFSLDGPRMLEQALEAGTGQGRVEAQIINGAPLKYNWERGDQAQGVNAREVLPQGAVTDLILTEAIPLDNHLQWSGTQDYAANFARLALEGNPEARIWLQETWHSLDSGTGVAVAYDENDHIPWRTRLAQDLPKWEGVITSLRAELPQQADRIRLIPAGQALARLSDEIAEGRFEGLDSVSALFADDIHLNDQGHYFITMVQYASLTGESPLGLPRVMADTWGQRYDTPELPLARELQRVAFEAVTDYRAGRPLPAPAVAAPQRPDPKPVAPATEAQAETPRPAPVGPGRGDLGIGLAPVTDWSTQQPFLNLMKTARPWIGHEPRKWGGMTTEELAAEGVLSEEGWPLFLPRNLGSIGTVILTDLPPEARSLAGRYRLQFTGKGIIEVAGRATGVRYGPGEVSFDFKPGPGSVEIRLQRINRGDPPRITSIVKLEHMAAFEAGAIFNPRWLALLEGFDVLRFMDWGGTNNATLARWEERPQVAQATWFDHVPYEVMIDLANETGIDPWFNIPHLADDAFVRAFGTLVAERLDPGLRAHVEFSNEVWNWQFAQARWADEQARDRWGEDGLWMQVHGLRAAEVAGLLREAFGPSAEERLVNVVATHTAWLGLEEDILQAPKGQAEGLPPPAGAFDAYAVTGYLGGHLGEAEYQEVVRGWLAQSLEAAQEGAQAAGLTGAAAEAHVDQHRYDLASQLAFQDLVDGSLTGSENGTVKSLLGRLWPHHAAVAERHGLDLMAYEGGTHVVGVGPVVDDEEVTAFMQHFNYSDQMGLLYSLLLDGWQESGGDLFVHFLDVYAPTKWGSWGALRTLSDETPRWSALRAAQ